MWPDYHVSSTSPVGYSAWKRSGIPCVGSLQRGALFAANLIKRIEISAIVASPSNEFFGCSCGATTEWQLTAHSPSKRNGQFVWFDSSGAKWQLLELTSIELKTIIPMRWFRVKFKSPNEPQIQGNIQCQPNHISQRSTSNTTADSPIDITRKPPNDNTRRYKLRLTRA